MDAMVNQIIRCVLLIRRIAPLSPKLIENRITLFFTNDREITIANPKPPA